MKPFPLSLALLAIGTFASLTPLKALDFTFYFENTFGSHPGSVAGTIYGLSDNANSGATDVVITSMNSDLSAVMGISPDYSPVTQGWTLLYNDFTVTRGQITNANFLARDYSNDNSLYLNAINFNFLTRVAAGTGNSGGFAGATYTPLSSVPEPSQYGLALFAFVAAFLARRRWLTRAV